MQVLALGGRQVDRVRVGLGGGRAGQGDGAQGVDAPAAADRRRHDGADGPGERQGRDGGDGGHDRGQ